MKFISYSLNIFFIFIFRVFVMESGRIVESGHPNILLQDRHSKFATFVSNR